MSFPHQACLSRWPDCGGKILAGSLATKLISIPINFNVCVHMSPSLSSPWVIFKTLLQKQTKTRNDKPKQVENHQGMDEIRFSYWQSQCLLLQHRFISLFYFLSFLWLVEMKTSPWVTEDYYYAISSLFFPRYNNPLNLSSEVQFSPL